MRPARDADPEGRLGAWSRRSGAVAVGATAVAGAATWLLGVERLAAGVAEGDLRMPRPAAAAALWAAHAAALAALGLALVAVGAVAGRAREGWRARAGGIAAALVCLAPGVLLGRSLAAGEWIARQPFAPAVRWGPAAALMAGAFAVGLLVCRPAGWRPPAWLWAALSAGAALADAMVLPGLYPAVHVLLYGLSGAFALLAAAAWLDGARAAAGEAGRGSGGRETGRAPALLARAPSPAWRWAGGAAAIALAGAAAHLATFGDAGRRALLTASPGVAVAAGAALPPSRERYLLRELQRLATAKPEAAGAQGTFRGAPSAIPRSVILLVVDTLRADALPPARGAGAPFAGDGDTPFLDGWLASSYRFADACAQASQTKGSMPPMFRSLQPFEDPTTTGVALPELMRRAGLLPVAVVPQYFLMPAQARSQQLLHGFERVAVYEKDHQEALVPQAVELLQDLGDQPFFAWIHFYAMHDPYFAGRPLSARDGSQPERYRAALRWLDGQLRELLGALERLGLARTTMVVLAADHGEHLGEGNRRGHGDGVHREEIHVPLAFHLPGEPGGVIEGLAGNIDIVPTLLDRLGQLPEPSHRGNSLLPRTHPPRKPGSKLYYVQNGTGSIHAILDDRSKLVYEESQRLLLRYDRREDPRDREDLFGEDPEVDQALVSALLRRNPALFAAELKDPAVREQLLAALRALDPASPPDHTGFLLDLAALAPSKEVLEVAERLFVRTRAPDVRAALVQRLFATDPPRWSRRLDRALAELSGSPGETHLVTALARSGQPAFSLERVASRLNEVDLEPPWLHARDWLELTRRWTKPQAVFAPPLARVLEALATRPPEEAAATAGVLVLALDNVATLGARPAGSAGEAAGPLEAAILPLAGDARVLVAAAACRALAPVGGERARAALLEVLDDRRRDARVRQAALRALASIAGADAVPTLLREGADPLLLADVLQLLGGLRDARALPFLEEVARSHSNGWTRKTAQRAAAGIRAP